MISEALELLRSLKNRRLSPGKLDTLQDRQLQTIVQHAYENVPYYRSLFQGAGISPGVVRTMKDLHRTSIRTKDALRKAMERLKLKRNSQDDIYSGFMKARSISRSWTKGSFFELRREKRSSRDQ